MTERMMLGNLGAFGHGIRIAKPGASWDSEDPYDLYFSTEFVNVGRVHATGVLVRGNTAFFPALSYIPLVDWAIIDTVANKLKNPTRITYSPTDWADYINTVIRLRRLSEPYFKIYTDRIVFSTLPNATITAPSLTMRYIVYTIPGGA